MPTKPLKTCLFLCFATLLVMTLVKLIFPAFTIELACTPRIVKIGTFVDTHPAVYYIVTGIISLVAYYLYFGACLCDKKLRAYEYFVIFAVVVIQFFLQENPVLFSVVVDLSGTVVPLLLIIIRKSACVRHLYSVVLTYALHTSSQAFSLSIRGIAEKITSPNTVSVQILLIDSFIVLVMLYLYFTRKEADNNGYSRL